jgi:hypothetical protein
LGIRAFITTPTGIIISAGLALLLGLVLWMYGAKAVNHLSGWWYKRGTDNANSEIEKEKQSAEPYKQVAADALKQLAEEKQRTAEERGKRELAEKILADKSKTTNEKLRAYQDAIDRAPTVSPPASTDELCARAQTLGISCGD